MFNFFKNNRPFLFTMSYLVAYYVLFVVTSIALLFSTNQALFWLLLVNAEDVMLVLKNVEAKKITLPNEWIDTAKILHRENPAVIYDLYKYYVHIGDIQNSSEMLYEANLFDPHNEEYRDDLVYELIRRKEYEVLTNDLKTRGSDDLNGKWSVPLYKVGAFYLDKGDITTAELYWRVAADISPSWSYLWIEHAAILSSMGKTKEAMDRLSRCGADHYSGTHCREVFVQIKRSDPPFVGLYRHIILHP